MTKEDLIKLIELRFHGNEDGIDLILDMINNPRLTKLTAQEEKAFYLGLAKEAFYLGFSISREGFNAEYPYKCFLDKEAIDPRLEEDWAGLRDKILKREGIV